MIMLRVLAIAVLACAPACGAYAASDSAAQAAPFLVAVPLLLGLKLCLVAGALGAVVERLGSGTDVGKT